MSLSNVSINNVSMDYFLRGVDAAKPQGAQPGAPAYEGANELVAQEPQGAGYHLANLKSMGGLAMRQASTSSLSTSIALSSWLSTPAMVSDGRSSTS